MLSCGSLLCAGSTSGAQRGMLLGHIAPARADLRAPSVSRQVPAVMASKAQGHGQLSDPKTQVERGRHPGVLSEQEQPSLQTLLVVAKGPGYFCIGQFGKIIVVRATSLPLLLTLAASEWPTRGSKSLYPITSLLSHACPLASRIIRKWQLNGKEVVLPIR